MEGLPPYATEKNYIEAKQIVVKLFINMEIHCFKFTHNFRPYS